jgi:hypothetical protein
MRDGFADLERALQRPRHSGLELLVPLINGCSARVEPFDARTPTGAHLLLSSRSTAAASGAATT